MRRDGQAEDLRYRVGSAVASTRIIPDETPSAAVTRSSVSARLLYVRLGVLGRAASGESRTPTSRTDFSITSDDLLTHRRLSADEFEGRLPARGEDADGEVPASSSSPGTRSGHDDGVIADFPLVASPQSSLKIVEERRVELRFRQSYVPSRAECP